MSVTVDQMQPEQMQDSTHHVARRTIIEMILGILFFAFLLWQINYLLNPTTLPIKQVRIEGKFKHLSPAALEQLVSDKVTGGFFNIDVSTVRNALLEEPWVSDVSVHRVWPDSLQVFVTEQEPVAIWGSTSLINDHGKVFTPNKDSIPENLPTLTGPHGSEKQVLEKFTYLQNELKKKSMIVTSLSLDERRAWMFEMNQGVKVMLGKKRFEARVARLVELIPQNLGDSFDHIERIDMRYPNGFAVRWKNSEQPPKLPAGNTTNG